MWVRKCRCGSLCLFLTVPQALNACHSSRRKEGHLQGVLSHLAGMAHLHNFCPCFTSAICDVLFKVMVPHRSLRMGICDIIASHSNC